MPLDDQVVELDYRPRIHDPEDPVIESAGVDDGGVRAGGPLPPDNQLVGGVGDFQVAAVGQGVGGGGQLTVQLLAHGFEVFDGLGAHGDVFPVQISIERLAPFGLYAAPTR